jgi:predicted ATPase
MNEHPTAEDSYRRALTAALGQRAKFWELCAATSFAHLWGDQARRDEARALLAPVYNWFTEGVNTPVLKEALLEQLTA